MATRCDLRDPGWGDPGFPQRGLLLPHLDGHLCRFAVFVWFFRWPAQIIAHKMLSNSSRAPHCPTALVFGCVVFCFVCFCCFVCGLCFWCFLVSSFCGLPVQLDSSMDYVKVRTRSLLQPSQATAEHVSHNSFPANTNLWNDLAKAMKASDGKKKITETKMCSFFFLWRGRNCTRLGPYNCVSSENLRKKDTYGIWSVKMANRFTNKQNQSHTQSDPQIPQPDLRFAANQTAKQHRKRGRAQQQQPKWICHVILESSTVSLSKTCKLISYCGRSSKLLHARMT